MFALVTRIKGTTVSIDTIVARVIDSLLPAVESISGFSGGFLLADRKNTRLMAVTLWREEKDIAASDLKAEEWREQAVKKIPGIYPPEIEVYSASYLPLTPSPQPTLSILFRPGIHIVARVTRIKGTLHEIEAVTRHFSEKSIPTVAGLPGFNGGMLFIDPEHNSLMTITLWQTEADLIASTGVENGQEAAIADLISAIGPPQVEYYEIQPLRSQIPG